MLLSMEKAGGERKVKKTFRTSYILEQNIQMSICTFDPTITELNLNTIPEI